jgi:RNA polymerase sigma-70 factor (ECF subfamily)
MSRSVACTRYFSAPRASRSRAGAPPFRTCAARNSTTWRCRPRTTALVSVLAKLSDYRGASRFTTWAYKFALLEAGVRLRRRAWQEREVVLEPEAWPLKADPGLSPDLQAQMVELMSAITESNGACLTSHQREVLVALTLNGVPIDVLADRLSTSRGALYKTLHDARRKLRADLAEKRFALDSI